MRALLLVTCVLVGCTVPSVPLEGKRCDADHLCVEGFVCRSGRCVSRDTLDGGAESVGPRGLCSVDGWCNDQPTQSCDLNALAQPTPGTVVAVGERGTILRRTDAGWAYDESPTVEHLYGVHAVAPDDLWAVGAGATVLRYRDGGWSESPIPGASGQLTSVFGGASEDGGSRSLFITSATGQVLRHDGTAWSSFDGGLDRPLRRGYCPRPDDCWIAGAKGLLRYRGGYAFTPSSAPLWDVWGSSSDAVWAVGEQGTVLRFDGGAWAAVDAGTSVSLRAVGGVAADAVWAGGERGLLRFDGGTWAPQPSPLFLSWPNAVVGSSLTDVWAAGMVGGTARFDGERWQSESKDLGEFYTGVFAVSPTEAWLFGGFFATLHRWDGQQWTSTPTPAPASSVLGGWASSSTDAVAVRGSGEILRWDGIRWSVVFGGNGNALQAAWGSGPEDVWVVGNAGTVVRWNGANWSYVQTPQPAVNLHSVWGSGPEDVWISGDNGTLWHWNGTALSVVASGTSSRLRALAGTSATDVWAGGDGVLLHLSAGAWEQVSGWDGRTVQSLFALAADDVYAVTSEGALFHLRGGAWVEEQTTAACNQLMSVHGTSAENIWVVGGSGTILRRKR